MAWFRKVKAGLVRDDIEDFVGEVGNIFFNIETGGIRLSDGVTPGGISVTGSINRLEDVEVINPITGDMLVYDADTSRFVNKSLGFLGGITGQVLKKQSSDDYDWAWSDSGDMTLSTLVENQQDQLIYVGEAEPESLPSSAVWRIQRVLLDSTGNVTEVKWADSGNFTQIWDERNLLEYA